MESDLNTMEMQQDNGTKNNGDLQETIRAYLSSSELYFFNQLWPHLSMKLSFVWTGSNLTLWLKSRMCAVGWKPLNLSGNLLSESWGTFKLSPNYGLNDMFPGNGVQRGFEIRFLLLGGSVKNVSPISSNMYNHAVLKRQLAQWVAQVKPFNMYPLQLGTRNDWRH